MGGACYGEGGIQRNGKGERGNVADCNQTIGYTYMKLSGIKMILTKKICYFCLMCLCEHMHVCSSVRSLGTKVTSDCEPPDIAVSNQTQIFYKNSKCS